MPVMTGLYRFDLLTDADPESFERHTLSLQLRVLR